MSNTENDQHGGDAPQEKTYDWHPLPMLIGNAITRDVDGMAGCGKWAVETEDGDVLIYRVVETAENLEDLPDDVEKRHEWDYAVGLELHVRIPEPEFGWDSEIDPVSESIWDGYK